MIFKEFVLHNFGIYRGRHVVNLETSSDKPIVLFGALNGAGKTTFLDGLQLVLYGKNARITGRGNMAYPDFLRSCINRHVSPTEGAALELEFSHHHEGRLQTIRIYRAWNGRGENVREKLEVFRDGIVDSILSEHWSEYVEDFIPSQISELFFFDGEKIEALAEENSASAIIRTGIHALLGLDVVDRLSTDLRVVQRRRKAEGIDKAGQERLSVKQGELDVLTAERKNLGCVAAEQTELALQIALKLKIATEQYQNQGGTFVDQMTVIQEQLGQLLDEKKLQDARLQELAAGAGPLLLVQDLLLAAQVQSVREKAATRAQELLNEFDARDSTVLATLRNAATPDDAIKQVSDHLAADRRARATQAKESRYLNVNADTLATFSDDYFEQVRGTISEQIALAHGLAGQIDQYERKIASIPSPESLAPIAQIIEDLNNSYQRSLGASEMISQQLDEIDRAVVRVEREYQALMAQEARIALKAETNVRTLEHVERIEVTLKRYRQAILDRNLAQLSKLILESFQGITRKKNMFARMEISPQDYRLSLYDQSNNLVPSYQLSAGERQLLAVSILWGLSRAAGRPLPAIIDTPLGRLDGIHRSKLVDNYFPSASHQVILLSTDQEIDDMLYPQLRHVISKEYLIEYNEETMSSEIRDGYFDFAEAAS